MKRDIADIRKPTNCACECSEGSLIVENENAKEHVRLCYVKSEFNGYEQHVFRNPKEHGKN